MVSSIDYRLRGTVGGVKIFFTVNKVTLGGGHVGMGERGIKIFFTVDKVTLGPNVILNTNKNKNKKKDIKRLVRIMAP